MNQSEIWSLTIFPRQKSEMNPKAIWSQSEIWKFNLKLKLWEMSILNNLNLNSRGKLIVHSLKLNSRGSFIVAACLSASIHAPSSLVDHHSAFNCLSFLNLIDYSLACRLALTLTASSETRLCSSIMDLSTSARPSTSALIILTLAALVFHGLYWVSKHSKINTLGLCHH